MTGRSRGTPTSRFNPRPCGRGDYLSGVSAHPAGVSIHAPAGGATLDRDLSPNVSSFNPRPCGRGDPAAAPHNTTGKCFNPRPCGRGDFRCARWSRRLPRFQSTPLREGRPRSVAVRAEGGMFQSTPLREGRPDTSTLPMASISFQSTPLREGRPEPDTSVSAGAVFQSTPLREGRRRRPGARRVPRLVSIHAPAGGATFCQNGLRSSGPSFNPRPCGRGDSPPVKPRLNRRCFNPRPCGRGDGSTLTHGDTKGIPNVCANPAAGRSCRRV